MQRIYPIQPFGGLDRSHPAHEISLSFTSDVNALWPMNGRLERIPGKIKYAQTKLDGDGVMRQCIYLDGAGTRHQIAITNTKGYHFTGSAFESIQDASDFTITADDGIDACTHYDSTGAEILVIANLVDDMRKWTGSGTLQILGGSPPKAKLLMAYRGFLLAGYVNESGNIDPRKVIFSALFNGESWPAENYFILKTSTDWLVAIKRMRDRVAIYKENSISLLDYVGGGMIFDLTENYKNGIGPVSRAAVVEWGEAGERHFFIGQDTNIYAFDGIDDANISLRINGILKDISPSKKHLISGTAIPEEGIIIWAVPLGGDTGCSDLVIFDVREGTWWMKYGEPVAIASFGSSRMESSYMWDTLPYPSWDEWSDAGGWDSRNVQANVPEVLVGGIDGYVRKLMPGVDDDGSKIPSYYFSAFDNLDGSESTVKQVNRVYVEVKCQGSGTISLQLFVNNDPDNPAILDESGNSIKSLNLFTSNIARQYKVFAIDVVVEGVNFAVRLSSDGLQWSGKVKGFDFELTGDEVDQASGSQTLIGADDVAITGADGQVIEVAS